MGKLIMPPLGWRPPLPDCRDHTFDPSTLPRYRLAPRGRASKLGSLPPKVSNRKWCGPKRLDQLQLGSCTANALDNLARYVETRALGTCLEHSRLFVYKTTRKLMGLTGDSGADIRSTMKAFVLFGAPPEKYWPYSDSPRKFDVEPPAFVYAMGQAYQGLQYKRLDPPGSKLPDVLTTIKQTIAGGWTAEFGFTVYSSFPMYSGDPDVPVPGPGESVEGGHAVHLIGYDDKRKIGKYTGAFEFENSWSDEWGAEGFGYLPYWYVLQGQLSDIWTLTKSEWFDTSFDTDE